MSLQGPIVVVADKRAEGLAAAITAAGAFPVVETPWADAAAAVETVAPAALVLAEPAPSDCAAPEMLARLIAEAGPAMPAVARADADGAPPFPGVLTVAADAPVERLIARIAGALRLRTLQGTVQRRAETLKAERQIIAELPEGDPLDEATVLVVGRGRSHPRLSVAVGERMGVMGALSIEAAARCLQAREIEGIAVGEGLGPLHVDALLSALADDGRFRDLPVGVLGDLPAPPALLNLVRAREPETLVERLTPLVRLRAFEGRLKRLLDSIEKKGMLDPRTGLLSAEAFGRDLARAIEQTAGQGGGLTVARLGFEDGTDRRSSLDAARLVGRLLRSVDFACRQDDGSILTVFSTTDLRSAHVVARRLAAVLRHTMLPSGPERRPVTPNVTLATLKPEDTPESLLARVAAPAEVAPARVRA